MIRTHILPCDLPKNQADSYNLESGRIYSQVLTTHWRAFRKSGHWLSHYGATKLNDWYNQDVPKKLYAHTLDAAQNGFYNACVTTRTLRKAGYPEANFPWRRKKFRTTTWFGSALKRTSDGVILSNAKGQPKVTIKLPTELLDTTKIMEVRLVYDKRSRRYNWHVVVENGKQPKEAPGNNIVSVDPGEIHPAVVGDEQSSTVITCRERRSKQRAHAKHLAKFSTMLSRCKKGSRRYGKLVRSKVRCKAKHQRVMRDIEHKVSKAIVEEAISRGASRIVYGDVRGIADGIDKGKAHNQRTSQWAHGKVRAYVEYKAQAEGITVVLQSERYTSQTCPNCQHRHKPQGRSYRCPACRFQAHRDVVGQVNILSAFKFGQPGKILPATDVKYRTPVNHRVLRKCGDTRQPLAVAQSRLPEKPLRFSA